MVVVTGKKEPGVPVGLYFMAPLPMGIGLYVVVSPPGLYVGLVQCQVGFTVVVVHQECMFGLWC